MHNISFETDIYDIYDPYFTSEDESSSGSSSYESSIAESESADSLKSELNEKDLEYDSQNNRSSLSSIHREMHEETTS